MLKFFKKIIILLLIVFFTICLIFLFDYFIIGNSFSDGYNASILDKIKRMDSINGPKILLVGNSNVDFGMDSNMLEEEFEMPVVDLGLHGGLGNAFHERIARLGVKKGDIVIVCHSDYSDHGSLDDLKLVWITIEYNKHLWRLLDTNDYKNMIRAYPNYVMSSICEWIICKRIFPAKAPYSRSSFNKYGDIAVRPNDINTYVFSKNSIVVPHISEICVQRLNKLNDYIKTKNATLLIAGYPIAYGEYTPPAKDFEMFQLNLEEQLNCEIISDFTDYFIPYKYFYNTYLHLTTEGSKIRTKQLIKDLRKWRKDKVGINSFSNNCCCSS